MTAEMFKSVKSRSHDDIKFPVVTDWKIVFTKIVPEARIPDLSSAFA